MVDERTPPVRRPARRDARAFVFAVVIAFVVLGQTRIDRSIKKIIGQKVGSGTVGR